MLMSYGRRGAIKPGRGAGGEEEETRGRPSLIGRRRLVRPQCQGYYNIVRSKAARVTLARELGVCVLLSLRPPPARNTHYETCVGTVRDGGAARG